jgi:hypothetical protein
VLNLRKGARPCHLRSEAIGDRRGIQRLIVMCMRDENDVTMTVPRFRQLYLDGPKLRRDLPEEF